VRKVKYNKPEMVSLGTAASAIQGMKKSGGAFELPPNESYHIQTVNAYEADE
jgi:hypothetical protein